MKVNRIELTLAASVIAVAVILASVVGCGDGESAPRDETAVLRTKKIRTVKPAQGRRLSPGPARPVAQAQAPRPDLITRDQLRKEFGDDYRRLTNDIVDELLKLTSERRDLFRRIFKASDPPNLKALVNLMQEAMNCDSPTVRSAIVGGLAGVGIEGMDALSEFLLDSDPDVAQQALDEFDTLLSEVEDEAAKIALCEKTMNFLRDEEAIRYIAVDLNGCDDQASAVEALVRVIGGTNAKAIEVAKESYEFITDEEFTTVEAAKKWIDGYKADQQDDN